MKKTLITLMLLSLTATLTHAKAKYCKDFATQAQKYFKTHNAKRLDRDKDGEACECLKGGSAENKSSCKRWRRKNGK